MDDTNRKIIAMQGGITSVITALKQHVTDEVVQEQCCAALVNLAYESADNQADITNSDGIVVLVTALKQHPMHTGVQQVGDRALGRLAYGNSDQQVAVAKAGGIEVLLAALKQHLTHAVLQSTACLALNHLAHGNVKNAAAIAEAATNTKIYGQMLLTMLSRSALKNSKKGGIAVAIATLKQRLTHVDSLSSNTRMQEEACNTLAIFTMFGNADEQLAIVNTGGIEAVVSVLKQRPRHASVWVQYCLALEELAKISDNQVAIAKVGGIAVVVDCEMFDGH